MSLIVLAGSLTLSAAFTFGARRFALKRGLLDQPDARRSHSVPTPRGGGMALVPAFVIGVGFGLGRRGASAFPVAGLPLLGLLAVWIVGLEDDRRELGMMVRLIVHLMASATLLPLVTSPDLIPSWMGLPAVAWWIFWTVSCVNVANFVDGIDGLLGSQAAIFGLYVLAVTAAQPGGGGSHAQVAAAGLTGATLGFLVWNWPPARIFLGDAGSGSLGFLMALVGALLMRDAGVPLVLVYLPLLPIFLDAASTRLRRVLRREGFAGPHRQHLYQRLANGGWGHARTTLLYAVAALVGAVAAWLWVRSGVILPAALYSVALTVTGFVLDRSVGWPAGRS